MNVATGVFHASVPAQGIGREKLAYGELNIAENTARVFRGVQSLSATVFARETMNGLEEFDIKLNSFQDDSQIKFRRLCFFLFRIPDCIDNLMQERVPSRRVRRPVSIQDFS